jgi:hypothetical protein
VSTADPIEQPDPGRDLGDVVLDMGDERGDDLVEPVEVRRRPAKAWAGAVSAAAIPRSKLRWALIPTSRCCSMIGREAAVASRASSHDFVAMPPVW